MSQKTRDTNIEQHEQHANELRAAADTIDAVARSSGGSVDDVLRDVEHIVENVAAILEEEDGEITREELAERVFPTGGVQ